MRMSSPPQPKPIRIAQTQEAYMNTKSLLLGITRALGLSALLVVPWTHADAANCVWNPGVGAFDLPANWSGCADLPGPSTRSPGVGDVALIANGTAQLSNSAVTVAELELGSGGVLAVVGVSLPTVTINTALRLSGGATTTVLGTNQLRLMLPAGATTQLLASSTLGNATFLINAGAMNVGSATGTSLTLTAAASLINQAGGTITMAGGDSRLFLTGSSTLLNEPGGTLNVVGNAVLGKPVAAGFGFVVVTNTGNFNVTGPGTLTLPNGGDGSVTLRQYGQMTVSNTSVVCPSAQCGVLFARDSNFPTTESRIHLVNATLDLGGASTILTAPAGTILSGTGTLNAAISLTGRLQPGAVDGPPYGTLSVSGNLQIGLDGRLEIDLGGTALGTYDRVTSSAALSVGSQFAVDGGGVLALNLAPGFTPAMGVAVPVIGYSTFGLDRGFNLIEANYALNFATRFDANAMSVFPAPRIALIDTSLIEGNSGESVMTFELRLSEPSTQTVTARLNTSISGTAFTGEYSSFALDGSAFFNQPNPVVTFAPGQTLRTVRTKISGDFLAEADEDFLLELGRPNLSNAAFGNGIRGHLSMVGTILTDDLPAGARYVLAAQLASSAGVRRYSSGGVFFDTWPTDSTQPSLPNTGTCFAPNGDVMVTRIYGLFDGPILFSRNGAARLRAFAGGSGVRFNNHESCVFTSAGDVYIGQAGSLQSTDAQVPILKFSATGVLLDRFVIPTGDRGTDWIELSSDQCTLYYTSEDAVVRRYNLCTRTPLPALISSLVPPCYALRLRANGELMVACRDNVYRITPAGAIAQTYTRLSLGETNLNGVFALNLDPDVTSFWTAGLLSGNVYRVDVQSGAVLTTFNGGANGVAGLAIYGELSESLLFRDGFEVGLNFVKSAVLMLEPADDAGATFPNYRPYEFINDGRHD